MTVGNLLIRHGILQAEGFTLSVGDLSQLVRKAAFVAGFLLTRMTALMWFRILATHKLSTSFPLFGSLTYFTLGSRPVARG